LAAEPVKVLGEAVADGVVTLAGTETCPVEDGLTETAGAEVEAPERLMVE